ncbi:MAG: lecithin retinol acyltransferase family protein [Bacteroidetes bacterium]|nr:lecithin retinol acyltransferase family protein [Bacteroidota bacterium]
MNNYITYYGLKPADRIIVPKSNLNLVQHHAIYLGQNEFGQDLLIENKFGVGVTIVTAEIFFAEVRSITRIERFNGNNYQRQIAVQSALQKSGFPYHLINYNCEHFANEVQYGQSSSNQVAMGIFCTALLCIAFIASSK